MRKGFAAVLLAAMIAATFVGIASWWADRQGSPSADSGIVTQRPPPGVLAMLDPPRPAPTTTFLDGDGKETSLAAFKGKTVVINLWATWCPPCVKEMPAIDRLSKALTGPEFAVIAISQDRNVDVVTAFFDTYLLDSLAPYLDERGKLSRALGAQGLPTTYVLDTGGHVVASMEGGAEWDSPAMIARLKMLSSQPSSKE